MFIDARIPVRFCDKVPEPALAEAALVTPEDAPCVAAGWMAACALPASQAHPPACPCCAGRAAQALPLARLFQARARGDIGFFRLVVACLPSEQASALRTALCSDGLLSGCFVVRD